MSTSQHSIPLLFTNDIDLENLEGQQDLWIRQYENSRRPPPQPKLNSPRSLRACELCAIDPQATLAKFSLRMHLNDIMGSPDVEMIVAGLSQNGNIRVATQEAMLAFQRAGIGMGTSKEKLLAYRSYLAQEAHRPAQLAAVREVRRQLIAEEAYERRRQQHVDSAERRPASNAGSRRGSALRREPSWSSAVAAGAHAPLIPTTPRDQVALPPYGSGTSVLSINDSHNGPNTSYRAYSPRAKPTPSLPYTPRDAVGLNTSYFGNRHISGNESNPSGARLPASEDNSLIENNAVAEAHPQGQVPVDDTQTPKASPVLRQVEQLTDKKDTSALTKEDNTVESINSSQLDWVLNMSHTPEKSPTAEVKQAEALPASLQGRTLSKKREEPIKNISPKSQVVKVTLPSPSAPSQPQPQDAVKRRSLPKTNDLEGIADRQPKAEKTPRSSIGAGKEEERPPPGAKESKARETSAPMDSARSQVSVTPRDVPPPVVPNPLVDFKLTEEEAENGVYVYCANATVRVL